ncbi:sulfite exporter TauE/SafE family protein [Reinekea sp.]|jgi:uncharacterized membrane protein YfcA|uniref:sulfite exporter TauE/SafE family protein n=1 Tax=Reinekea sp. TaxID=1970455 RepID=UPI002A82325B|nr:sulfite exporter TauE/SafE family protein [Reinekea sp.]
MEITLLTVSLLLGTGLVAGIINTLAGGGSNLTLPALMIMGLPADAANATNRVGVIMHTLVTLRGFSRHGKLPMEDAKGLLIPVLVGGLLGSVLASYLPTSYLKPILLTTMISMSLLMLFRPGVVFPSAGEQPLVLVRWSKSWWLLMLAGVYGGFVQAGVGFVLIAVIAGGLRYDLIRTNALKIMCTGAFTGVALALFIWRGQVVWVPGLILASATMVGGLIGVRLALNISPQVMKWVLFVMTLVVSIAALI